MLVSLNNTIIIFYYQTIITSAVDSKSFNIRITCPDFEDPFITTASMADICPSERSLQFFKFSRISGSEFVMKVLFAAHAKLPSTVKFCFGMLVPEMP